jgi:glycerate 2-kinase
VGRSQAVALKRPLERLRQDGDRIFHAALEAVAPSRLLGTACDRGALNPLARLPVVVISAGKAAWPMAKTFVDLAPVAPARGMIAGPRIGAALLPDGFESYNAGHPAPNAASVAAGWRALALANEVGAERFLVVLLSGGASAMLAAPAASISLDEKIITADALMQAGVGIDGLNCVRKHLSMIKGGRLGATAFQSLTLAISDVHTPVPDDRSVIGSGPTVPDPTTFLDALATIRKAAVDVPARVRAYLERGANGQEPETIKPGDTRLARAYYEIIGTRLHAIEGARKEAEAAGYFVDILSEPTSGEARVASAAVMARARRLAAQAPRPLCVLASGETTVRVIGDGVGGRNQEFALAAVPHIGSIGRSALLASIGTDGADGPTNAAGAVVDSSTLERSERAGVSWEASLNANDSYHFFEPLGDLIITGPTGTNVGDLHVVLIA